MPEGAGEAKSLYSRPGHLRFILKRRTGCPDASGEIHKDMALFG